MSYKSDYGKGKGGSYPNFGSHMKYELPIPFTPLGPPGDAYRDGWDRIFGPKCLCPEDWKPAVERGVAGHVLDVCPMSFMPPRDAARVQPETPVQCEVCGDPGYHRLDRGVFSCEIES